MLVDYTVHQIKIVQKHDQRPQDAQINYVYVHVHVCVFIISLIKYPLLQTFASFFFLLFVFFFLMSV
jgi:hypothetical protein